MPHQYPQQRFDTQTGAPLNPASSPLPANDYNTLGAKMVPYKNGMGLAAYYCGIVGLIPFLLPASVAAIITGVMGVKRANANPAIRGKAHAISGIVMGSLEIFIFIAFIVIINIAAHNPSRP